MPLLPNAFSGLLCAVGKHDCEEKYFDKQALCAGEGSNRGYTFVSIFDHLNDNRAMKK